MLLLSAPSAFASEGCPNEAVRAESNVNPTTGQPYSHGLPECRAYEMVSPLEKQQHDAVQYDEPPFMSVSPEGTAFEWVGEGDYAGAEGYDVGAFSPTNPYVAQRTSSGWMTRSAYPPANLLEAFPAFGGVGVYSPNLADEAVCGGTISTGTEYGPTIRCALRDSSGLWTGTSEYTELNGEVFGSPTTEGASTNGEDYVFHAEPGAHFLPADESANTCGNNEQCGGIYELAGLGTSSPELRLVDVDNNGDMIGPETVDDVGAVGGHEPAGSKYQAISSNGSRIFFTATPSGGVPTIYARVNGAETVAISNPAPSECNTCNATPAEGRYEGASANGEKVFFITTQQLLDSDTDEELDLYEYDFNNPNGHELVQVSRGGLGDVTPGAGAEVQGVVDVSEDGSHVYFVAHGILTTLPNGLGQTAVNEAYNLYGYDTDTGETKFVATLPESDDSLWGFSQLVGGSGHSDTHLAQTTPDGRYLVFDTTAKLITTGPEADTSGAEQVYRYDFKTGSILRISVGHEGFANNGNTPGFGAIIAPMAGEDESAAPTVNDVDRTISESGEAVAFVSAAPLQSTDVAEGTNTSCVLGEHAGGAGCEIYVWHNGSVNMVSDGLDPVGVIYAGMSATGSDIFFQSATELVGQDTDSLGDIYDARVDGGFPAPVTEPTCSGEACQGTQSATPTFATPGTASFTGGADDVTSLVREALKGTTKAKTRPLTEAQKLVAALKLCKKDKVRSKRQKCEKAAHKRYPPARHRTPKKH
jgi:hypothetical protein